MAALSPLGPAGPAVVGRVAGRELGAGCCNNGAVPREGAQPMPLGAMTRFNHHEIGSLKHRGRSSAIWQMAGKAACRRRCAKASPPR